MSCLFYCSDSDDYVSPGLTIGDSFSWKIWKPSLLSVKPDGIPLLPYLIWWVMHHLNFFTSRDYGIFVVYAGHRIVHYSGIYPRYFRFPFMSKYDLQIGNTWTDPAYRGKGLAAFAIQKVVEIERIPGRRIWYLTEEDNIASIRAAEKAGLAYAGSGMRTSRLGMRILGSFVLMGGGKGSTSSAL